MAPRNWWPWPMDTGNRPGRGRICWVNVPAAACAPQCSRSGTGALGFWAALREVFPGTREQRDWVHKVANVYGAKFSKATAKITDDLDVLLTFYDYPAEHWIHEQLVERPTDQVAA
jgi:transposase-like protein